MTLRSPSLHLLVLTAIGIAAAAVTTVWMGEGLLSLRGLLLLLVVGAGGVLALARFAPGVLVVLAPALLPLPLLFVVFPFELAFYLFAFLLALHALRARPEWLTRLDSLEVANLLFVSWAALTLFWSTNLTSGLLGIRRYVLGMAALWVASRMARLVPRPVFEIGLAAGALGLGIAALVKRASLGHSESFLQIYRATATDLGWGTANLIATLLLILGPPLLISGWGERDRWLRWISIPSFALVGIMQIVIASRAAAVLFSLGLMVQIVSGWTRRRVAFLIATAVALAGLLMTPVGAGFLGRFSNPRDLGSMTVRIWYFREAWHRMLDNFPWGIGLVQGLEYPDKLQNIDPHNYWLTVGSELGLPGLVLWIAVLILLWRRLCVMARTPGWERIGRALQISFWLSQLHTLVEPTFSAVQYQFLYFWLMGGYLGYFRARVAALEPSEARVRAPLQELTASRSR